MWYTSSLHDFISFQEAFTSDEPGGILDTLLSSNITKALLQEGTDQQLIDPEELKEVLREYFGGDYVTSWEETFDTIDYVVKQVGFGKGFSQFHISVARTRIEEFLILKNGPVSVSRLTVL